MSSSNCCFLTCIQVSQEAGQLFSIICLIIPVLCHIWILFWYVYYLFIVIFPCFLTAFVIVFVVVVIWLFATPWSVAHQAPLSMGFFREEYWSGLPFSLLRDLPNPGIRLAFPTLAGGFFNCWAVTEVQQRKTPPRNLEEQVNTENQGQGLLEAGCPLAWGEKLQARSRRLEEPTRLHRFYRLYLQKL